jgi:hypothetical protein
MAAGVRELGELMIAVQQYLAPAERGKNREEAAAALARAEANWRRDAVSGYPRRAALARRILLQTFEPGELRELKNARPPGRPARSQRRFAGRLSLAACTS